MAKAPLKLIPCETGLTLSEIRYMKRHLRSFSREAGAYAPGPVSFQKFSKTRSLWNRADSRSPWNYPFLLSMEPMVDALAAGNTVILKPSAYSPVCICCHGKDDPGILPSKVRGHDSRRQEGKYLSAAAAF